MNDIVNVITDNKTLIISIIIFFVCVIIGFFGDLYLKKQNKILSKKDLNDDALQKEETKEETKQETLDKQDMDSTYPDNLPIDIVDNKDELNTINSNIDDNNFDNSNISSDTNIKEFNETYENSFSSTNINTDNQNIENQNDTYQYSNINFNTDDDNKFNNMF